MKQFKTYCISTVFILGLIIYSNAQDSLNMRLVYHWDDLTIIVTKTWAGMEQQYNEIWGYYDPINDREYGIIGTGPGTYIFDVTDENNISIVDYELGSDTADIHRDYKTYKNYLYAVADEGASTLQIFDLSYLPDSVHKVYDSNEFVVTSHNGFIDNDKLYLCGVVDTNSRLKALRVLSLADPEKPKFLVDAPMTGQGGYTHDVYVRNDTAYCSNLNNGLFVYDFSDVLNPVLISSITSYEEQGVNHSSWMSDDGKTLFFVDETHGKGIKTFNIEDLSDMYSVSLFRSNAGAMPHNVFVKENKLYVSYYHDGVWIFDVENPETPTVLGYYDTYQEKNGYKSYQGCWGVYPYLPSGLILASDFTNGFFVMRYDTTITDGLPTKLTEKRLNVWPNHVNNVCFIDIPQDFRSGKLTIYSPLGKLVEVLKINGNSLVNFNMSNYSKGIFIFELSNKNQVLSTKVVKK